MFQHRYLSPYLINLIGKSLGFDVEIEVRETSKLFISISYLEIKDMVWKSS